MRSSKASSKRFEGDLDGSRMCIIYIHPALRLHLRSSEASSERFAGDLEVSRRRTIYIHPALRFHLRSPRSARPCPKGHRLRRGPYQKATCVSCSYGRLSEMACTCQSRCPSQTIRALNHYHHPSLSDSDRLRLVVMIRYTGPI